MFLCCPSAVVRCSGWIPKKRKDSRKTVLKAGLDIAETTLLASAWTTSRHGKGGMCICTDSVSVLINSMTFGLCFVPNLSGVPKKKRMHCLPLGIQTF